ncbi:MAG: hypothetical protein AB2L24_02095 [Mangrovibacterium sp.]
MKAKIPKLMAIILLLSLMGTGCEKEDEYSDLVEGYIVGSFICYEIGPDGQATGNQTDRGYCILLEGSENADSHWPMDFYTFDLPSGLFDFPEEIILPGSNGNDCGPWVFPDDSRNVYKIKFNYRILNERGKVKFFCGACMAMHQAFPWDDYNEVSLKNLSKIN